MEHDDRIIACMAALELAQSAMDMLNQIAAEREGIMMFMSGDQPN